MTPAHTPLPRRTTLRRLATLAAIVAGLAGLRPAAVQAQAIVVRDDRGIAHRLAAPPQRIVSMLPSLTETAWVLGVGPQLVGVDRYSNWPADLARLPHLGGLDDAQIEAIAALKPDLILASPASRSMERLEVLGFTVVRLKSESYADVRRTLDVVARLLGTPDEGARVWTRLTREVDAAAARVPPSMRGQRVYFEIGGGPYAAGTVSFIGETLARLGMANIVPPDLGPFPKLNPEFVVRARPDVIMGVQREQSALVDRPGWNALAAVRDKRLCGFETAQYEMLIRPGPRLGEAAGLLADCLVRLGTASTGLR
ncbi:MULTISPECIES: helical backbone metal receptor [unclassified Methylibium]|uniref:ABC transporter substrate-binding protein n=1 Tax=unclassified Methylibium TaxID=2633235 RepID=UPI0003F3E67C|nr:MULTISPECIES: helical backbone metal receptor [unclassified Methylibium]EWS52540.1 Vitamin B12-binding protein precursor [Methylibium sp. T29]EWS59966.1 Vitamin B12-binding protein precursor [Methylibium sp. T29-B]